MLAIKSVNKTMSNAKKIPIKNKSTHKYDRHPENHSLVHMVDPPSGWKYGFPKPVPNPVPDSMIDWMVSEGYPKDKTHSASFYSNHFYVDIKELEGE